MFLTMFVIMFLTILSSPLFTMFVISWNMAVDCYNEYLPLSIKDNF